MREQGVNGQDIEAVGMKKKKKMVFVRKRKKEEEEDAKGNGIGCEDPS